MSSAVISVQDLSFAYDKNLILDNVNFSIKEGDFVAIVGENGAGKSTLMNLILHNLNNYDGEIWRIFPKILFYRIGIFRLRLKKL